MVIIIMMIIMMMMMMISIIIVIVIMVIIIMHALQRLNPCVEAPRVGLARGDGLDYE